MFDLLEVLKSKNYFPETSPWISLMSYTHFWKDNCVREWLAMASISELVPSKEEELSGTSQAFHQSVRQWVKEDAGEVASNVHHAPHLSHPVAFVGSTSLG